MPPQSLRITRRMVMHWHNPVHREPVSVTEFEMGDAPPDPDRLIALATAFNAVFAPDQPVAGNAGFTPLVTGIASAIQARYDLAPPVVGAGHASDSWRPLIYVAWRDQHFAPMPGEAALTLVARALGPDGADPARLTRQIERLVRTLGRHALNQLPRAMAAEAEARGMPWRRLLASGQHVAIGFGRHRRIMRNSMGEQQPAVGTELARDKAAHLALLELAGMPVGAARGASSVDEALAAGEAIGYPVALKPVAGSFGRGVFARIEGAEAMRAAATELFASSNAAIVQRFFAGSDHRLLVIDGQLVAAASRLPPTITGDGHATVAALIDRLNADPRRGRPNQDLLDTVAVDEATHEMLARQGLGLSDVPAEGQVVRLKQTANIHTGGVAEDVLDRVHPDNAALAARAARLMALRIAGVDLITEDIGRSWREVPAGICEVNGTPGLRPHWIAAEGNPEAPSVGGLLLEAAMEGTGDGTGDGTGEARIPAAMVAGAAAEPVMRAAGALLAAAGRAPGVAGAEGVWIDGVLADPRPAAGPEEAWRVLGDPGVGVALLGVVPERAVAAGLALPSWQVAALVGAQALPEALAKRLADGADQAVVLDPAIPGALALAEAVLASGGPRLILAVTAGAGGTGDAAAPLAKRVLAAGGAVVEPGAGPGALCLRRGGEAIPLAGPADPIMAAAVAIAVGFGLAPAEIIAALPDPLDG